MRPRYGGIEAGGTKFVCAVGSGPAEIVDEICFRTTTPQETLQQAVDLFQPYVQSGQLASVGIGAFGPLDLNPISPTFGYITSTPKPGWSQVDIAGVIQRALQVPVSLDTDVNAAALGEQFWIEENHSLDPFVYMTVGTGIGVGILINYQPVHGMVHPEAGHIFIPHSHQEDPFEGVCPYHGDCLEGLASGPAMHKRWGVRAEDLPDGHPGWELEAKYIASGICNVIYSYSPQRIILGGGVLQHRGLLQQVRKYVLRLSNGYIRSPRLLEQVESYIVSPSLGQRAGVLGGIALALAMEREIIRS